MQQPDKPEGATVAVEEGNSLEQSPEFALNQEQDGPEEQAPDFAGDVLASLEGVEVEGGKPVSQPAANDQPAESEEMTPEARLMAAQMTAAVATGGLATGIEFFLKGAKVSDGQRLEFAEALAPVLAKSNGTLPPWLTKLLADWDEELKLARKTVAIGWAIREQLKAERAKEITLPEIVPGPEPKQRVRVPKEETSQEAA